jgi:hypothetical protein
VRDATWRTVRARPELGRPRGASPIYVPRMWTNARQGGSGVRPSRGNGVNCPGIGEALVETGALHFQGNPVFAPRQPRLAQRHAEGAGAKPPDPSARTDRITTGRQ